MAFRLTLLCCAGTKSARHGGFGDPDEPLDDGGHRRAMAFRPAWARAMTAVRSPSLAAQQTAECMGLASAIEPALAAADYGEWRGRSFENVQREAPESFDAWLSSPEAGCPDGESLQAVQDRVSKWLGCLERADQHAFAITHPMIVRTVLSETLRMPSSVAMLIDIAPLASVRLSFNRCWRLQEISTSPSA